MTSQVSSALVQLLALRRVLRGHVMLLGDDLFLDGGRRIPGPVHDSLRDLLSEGHLRLWATRAEWNQREVRATPSGERLLRELEATAG